MTALDDRWSDEVDAFIQQFAERAATWDEYPGDLEDGNAGIVRPDDGWDAITVLRARGRRLAKRIARDGTIIDYDAAKHFDLTETSVAGLDHLAEDLERLLHQPDRCVVRGRIADIGRATYVRRLLHPEGDDPASLIEVPRRWLALDIDGLARPANVAVSDLNACAGIAIATLPPEFHEARCLVAATAGHGYKPGLRLRLWFWLDRLVSGAELKCWLDPAVVDHALFGAAQPVYTAAPVFAGGQRDPLPERLIPLRHGTRCVRVPDILELEPRPEPPPIKPATGLSRYAEVALDNAARRIAEARAGERDLAINAAAYGIGRLAGAGAIPAAFARRVLHHATAQIPGYSPSRDSSKVDRSFANGLRNPREARP